MSKTDITKQVLANSIKRLIVTCPLKKLSVKMIMDDCGLNRSTFYYHFMDIKDLIFWIYENEVTYHIRDTLLHQPPEKWTNITEFTLKHVNDNRVYYRQALQIQGCNNFNDFILSQVCGNWKILIDRYCAQKYSSFRPEMSKKTQLAEFFAYAQYALVIKWVQSGFTEPLELLVNNINQFSNVALISVIDQMARQNNAMQGDIKQRKVWRFQEFSV